MQTLQQLRNGELKGIVKLKLSEELDSFPKEIFELAETLEMIDLSKNNIDSLPADFGRLKKLKTLFCFDNKFTVLPEVLADCPLLNIAGFRSNLIETIPPRSLNPNLRWLILTNNRISNLPAEIGKCHRMEKLMLAGNKLSSLPIELSQCHNLALFRISANRFTELPLWLLEMPKLSWLAFAGNPFSMKPKVQDLAFIDWAQLQIAHQLGEGASGVIYQATHNTGDNIKEVAVKIFKGAITSDGLPEDEMNAFIAAGPHDGLIGLRGQIAGHPENKKGLVMELIPPRFFNLGLTPTLDSCSRDVFKESLTLTVGQVLKIAVTIASVGAQLHNAGIMHSDLYAHNTLIDDEGNTLFGDFGAALFYDKTDVKLAASLERLEVSAYGYLLDDLLGLCRVTDDDPIVIKIGELRDECLAPTVATRPGFADLQAELETLQAVSNT